MSHHFLRQKRPGLFVIYLVAFMMVKVLPAQENESIPAAETVATGVPGENAGTAKVVLPWLWRFGFTQRLTIQPLPIKNLPSIARRKEQADFFLAGQSQITDIHVFPLDFFLEFGQKNVALPGLELNSQLSVQFYDWQPAQQAKSTSSFYWPSAPQVQLTQFSVNLTESLKTQIQSYSFLLQVGYTLPWQQSTPLGSVQHTLGAGLGARYTMFEIHYSYSGHSNNLAAGSYSGVYQIWGDGSVQEDSALHLATNLYYQMALQRNSFGSYFLRLGFEYNTSNTLTAPRTAFTLQGPSGEILYRSLSHKTGKTELFNFSNFYISFGTQNPL